MHELCRRVRFCLPLGRGARRDPPSAGRHNTFAAWPNTAGLAVYYELAVRCGGKADPVSGFVASIAAIDTAVRNRAIPLIDRGLNGGSVTEPARILRGIVDAVGQELGGSLRSITWCLTPFYSVEMEARAMDRVILRQHFEFAAAHRLHSDRLADAQNRSVFGKCNNLHGHGHNYRLEVAVSAPLAPDTTPAPVFTLIDLERIVDETVVRRFDHTNLNLDTAEFDGLVPSVEHIARVCFELLEDPIRRSGGRLEPITVWETEKTGCTYPAPPVLGNDPEDALHGPPR